MRFFGGVLLIYLIVFINCWTREDKEILDMIESTPQNFYDVLGVDSKASASDIRKAYHKLALIFHPDKNKHSNSEETFRKIAAIANVLQNGERRKTYDLILKNGIPDWRAPIYQSTQITYTELLKSIMILFILTTIGQYLFLWSLYVEKKKKIEFALPRIGEKEKNQRKGENVNTDEVATVSEAMATLQKPRFQDLFPARLLCFFIYFIKSSPSYLASCRDYIKLSNAVPEEESHEEPQHCTDMASYDNDVKSITNGSEDLKDEFKQKQKWIFSSLTELQLIKFKKAVKKFPVGTLQRLEKVAAYLDCSVSEVKDMIQEMKNERVSKSIPASMQGIKGTEMEDNFQFIKESGEIANGKYINSSTISQQNNSSDCDVSNSEKCENKKQDDESSLELVLQKSPEDKRLLLDGITFV